MAKIYVIMGKSSTGKDTVYKELINNNNIHFHVVTMYTTRPQRSGEAEGREYFFTDEDKVEQFIRDNKIIELRAYNTMYGVWKYFTADDGQIDISSTDLYLMIGTLEAYNKLIEFYGKENVIPIYIEIDDKTRIHRAIDREDSQKEPKYTEMCRRFIADEEDFSEERLAEAGIDIRYVNYNLKDCVDKIIIDIVNSSN